MSPVDLKDYVDVKERLRLFYEAHPEGRIQSEVVLELTTPELIVMKAYAYRSPDDPLPGTGYSWLKVPGSTAFTRGSEIENAETSAWGRAIGALGIGIAASIASSDEVAAKAAEPRKTNGAIPPDTDEPVSLGPALFHGAIFVNDHPTTDGEIRETPTGWRLGFGMELGGDRKLPQVVALDALAVDISDAISGTAKLLHGMQASVEGELFDVPWRKNGKRMPTFKRLVLARITTPDWTLPEPVAVEQAPGMAHRIAVEEGATEALFDEPEPVA